MDKGLVDRLSKLTRAQQCFVLGVIGAALQRDWQAGGDSQAEQLADLFDAVRALQQPSSDGTLPIEVSALEGYAEWAPNYDEPNPMIEAEESLVHSLVAPLLHPNVVVLDAACGTGRHLAWATSTVYRSIGIDVSSPMLQYASKAASDASLLQADLRALPLAQRSVDVAICSLALCHLSDIESALGELARVIRPGGALVVSDPHGRAAYAGGQGFFGSGGVTRPRFVRNHYRQAHEWFHAFQASGFMVESCHEPRMSSSDATKHPAAAYFPAAAVAAFRDVPYLWVWSVRRRAD